MGRRGVGERAALDRRGVEHEHRVAVLGAGGAEPRQHLGVARRVGAREVDRVDHAVAQVAGHADLVGFQHRGAAGRDRPPPAASRPRCGSAGRCRRSPARPRWRSPCSLRTTGRATPAPSCCPASCGMARPRRRSRRGTGCTSTARAPARPRTAGCPACRSRAASCAGRAAVDRLIDGDPRDAARAGGRPGDAEGALAVSDPPPLGASTATSGGVVSTTVVGVTQGLTSSVGTPDGSWFAFRVPVRPPLASSPTVFLHCRARRGKDDRPPLRKLVRA